MKNFCIKNLIVTFIGCLLALTSNAQLLAPENIPISFYGKVIDQEGRPVTSAKVTFDLIVSHMAENRTETTPMALQTDKNGIFALTDVTGYGIDRITIEKRGFKLSQKPSRSYVFGLKIDYRPNPNSPVIFKMWKTGGIEPLIESSWHGNVYCDGRTNRFDLLHGYWSDDGALEIVCARAPLNYERTSRQPYSYKFEITIVGGGIQPTQDEFTYLAPDAGYLPNVSIERKPGDPQWKAGVEQELYIKTANGKYGRIFVRWDAGHRPPPTFFEWDCSINPSGSRNLER